MGFAQWIRPVVGVTETFAAILFLVPFTRVLGGYMLLLIFALAVVIHILHGEMDVGALIVYGMVVVRILTNRKGNTSETQPRPE